MKADSWFRAARATAPLAAVFLLTGAINVSCAGDPPDATGGGSGARPASHAMGRWTPVSGVDTCTQAEHDEHFVIGPDGRKYPTWHAATFIRSDSTTCSYGHEHGDNPANSPFFAEIQRHFAWDANNNGILETTELSASGIPFGYVAEQLDVYNAAVTPPIAPAQGRRYQPHTAYKIAHVFGTRSRIAGGVITDNYVACSHLVAINQDTVTADAFASNMHEAIVALDCGTTGPYPVRLIASGMMNFGNANTFDAAALSSTAPQPITPAGQTAVPPNSATNVTSGRRAIPGAVSGVSRMWDNAFVAIGATSNIENAISERSAADFSLVGAGGMVATVRPTVTALEPGRFYDPGAAGLIGRSVALCYSGLNAGGLLVTDPASSGTVVRHVRGTNECSALGADAVRLSTAIASRVSFDSATSPFRNCRRKVTFGNVAVSNGGGATTQYSDPFGRDTQAARANSRPVRQFVAAVNTATLAVGGIDLQALEFAGNTCVPSLHLPN